MWDPDTLGRNLMLDRWWWMDSCCLLILILDLRLSVDVRVSSELVVSDSESCCLDSEGVSIDVGQH